MVEYGQTRYGEPLNRLWPFQSNSFHDQAVEFTFKTPISFKTTYRGGIWTNSSDHIFDRSLDPYNSDRFVDTYISDRFMAAYILASPWMPLFRSVHEPLY